MDDRRLAGARRRDVHGAGTAEPTPRTTPASARRTRSRSIATPPTITLTTPANGSSTNDTTPTLSGVAGIAAGDLATVTVTVYNGPNTGGTVAATLPTTRNGVTGAYTIDASALPDGTYTAIARQQDAAGNTGSSSANTFVVDTAPPVVTLTNPAGGLSTNDTTPTYNGTATAATGDSATVVVKIYAGGTATGIPVQTLNATAQRHELDDRRRTRARRGHVHRPGDAERRRRQHGHECRAHVRRRHDARPS